MASPPSTPEALLGRNDSKNPATTCKGITSSGRPCRRALASLTPSPPGKRNPSVGDVAVFEEDGAVAEAAFYCWQHKDQAQERVQPEQVASDKPRKQRPSELYPLQQRSSIDTLVQRLGIESLPGGEQKMGRRTEHIGTASLPQRTVKRSLPDVAQCTRTGSERAPYEEKSPALQRPPRRSSKAKEKPSFWAILCCVTSDSDDYIEIVRHRTKHDDKQHRRTRDKVLRPPSRVPRHESETFSASVPARQLNPVASQQAMRPIFQQHTTSNPYTGHLLSLIPQHCSPSTASSLLSELIKPISPADEDGYIYIFWLTPQSKEAPEEATARSLLVPPEKRPQHARRISDVMTEYSYDGSRDTTDVANNESRKTIMLKIGRASNVTRRMAEWQRQCGYKLNLIRWYPYVPSPTTPSPRPSPGTSTMPEPLYPDLSKPPSASRGQSEVVRKVPFVKRVERLIHLELAEQRVVRDCETCGKEHREWFEVKANQDGVRAVDECVRRWVAWAENRPTNE